MNGIDLNLMGKDKDVDDATDDMLFRDNQTWSKGKLKRAKVMSLISGRTCHEWRIFCSIFYTYRCRSFIRLSSSDVDF